MLSPWQILEIPRLDDARGSLSFLEIGGQVPFEIRRVYYLYNVPENQSRGAHAHKNLHQIMLSISGTCSVELTKGRFFETVELVRPNQAIYIPPMTWRDLRNFSANSVVMVLASEIYDEADYIRERRVFDSLSAEL